MSLKWETSGQLRKRQQEAMRKIRHYKRKFRNPINNKGQPLQDSTLTSYRYLFKLEEQNKIWLGNLIKELRQYDMDYILEGLKYPLSWKVRRGPPDNTLWTILEGLMEVKQLIANGTELDEDDFVNMLKFILDYPRTYPFIDKDKHLEFQSSKNFAARNSLCEHIAKVFIGFLDYVSEQKSDKAQGSKTQKVEHSFKIIDGGKPYEEHGSYAPGNPC